MGTRLFVKGRGFRAAAYVVISLVLAAGNASQAALVTVTINNTSSSNYQLFDLNLGTVVQVQHGPGFIQAQLDDVNHYYEIAPGQPNDQGSHFFRLNNGVIDYPGLTVPTTKYFRQDGPTTLTIDSVAVHFRMISGPSTPNTFLGAHGLYFDSQAIAPGGEVVAYLTPSEGNPSAGRGQGFTGNWKNIFSFGGAQHTPMQLAVGDISSMTGDGGLSGGIVTNTLVHTTFVEGGRTYNGWQFTVANGSEWLYFTEIPEPSSAALILLAGAAALARRGRQTL